MRRRKHGEKDGMNPQPTTRVAPSPTGALHLGNARTFLINWALARQNGWRIVLRIEDLDGPRVKPGVIESTIETLRWLGIDWDVGPVIQSHDLEPYRAAVRSLASRGLAYPSELSRGEIESAASAPQEGVHESVFPASLRPALHARAFDSPETNWRFVVPDSSGRIPRRVRGAAISPPGQDHRRLHRLDQARPALVPARGRRG
jgi:glutamyl-tRNA synthetase